MSIFKKLFEIQGIAVKKDASNPFFKSKYMSLDNIVEVLKPILDGHKLLVYHFTENKEMVTSVHDIESNEYVMSKFPLIESNDPQKYGSCITYAKRYNLGEIFNIITDEDDDGNKASEKVINYQEVDKALVDTVANDGKPYEMEGCIQCKGSKTKPGCGNVTSKLAKVDGFKTPDGKVFDVYKCHTCDVQTYVKKN